MAQKGPCPLSRVPPSKGSSCCNCCQAQGWDAGEWLAFRPRRAQDRLLPLGCCSQLVGVCNAVSAHQHTDPREAGTGQTTHPFLTLGAVFISPVSLWTDTRTTSRWRMDRSLNCMIPVEEPGGTVGLFGRECWVCPQEGTSFPTEHLRLTASLLPQARTTPGRYCQKLAEKWTFQRENLMAGLDVSKHLSWPCVCLVVI